MLKKKTWLRSEGTKKRGNYVKCSFADRLMSVLKLRLSEREEIPKTSELKSNLKDTFYNSLLYSDSRFARIPVIVERKDLIS